MPQGFQSFNADGSIQIDVTTSLTRVLGRTVTGAGVRSGSLVNANFALGIPWAVALVLTAPSNDFQSGVTPVVTISGTTLSWQWSVTLTDDFIRACHIIYGIR